MICWEDFFAVRNWKWQGRLRRTVTYVTLSYTTQNEPINYLRLAQQITEFQHFSKWNCKRIYWTHNNFILFICIYIGSMQLNIINTFLMFSFGFPFMYFVDFVAKCSPPSTFKESNKKFQCGMENLCIILSSSLLLYWNLDLDFWVRKKFKTSEEMDASWSWSSKKWIATVTNF